MGAHRDRNLNLKKKKKKKATYFNASESLELPLVTFLPPEYLHPRSSDVPGVAAIPTLVEPLYRVVPRLNGIANTITPNLIGNLLRTSMSLNTHPTHPSLPLFAPILSRPVAAPDPSTRMGYICVG